MILQNTFFKEECLGVHRSIVQDDISINQKIQAIISNSLLLYTYKYTDKGSNCLMYIFLQDKYWDIILLSNNGITQYTIKPILTAFQRLFMKPKQYQIQKALFIQMNDFKEIKSPSIVVLQQFLEFENNSQKQRKIGILYQKCDQNTEQQMLQNTGSFENFEQFLSILGQRIQITNGLTYYTGGLDAKGRDGDVLYTHLLDTELAFHVSTWLKHVNNDDQQLIKKRHIGNDNIIILFQEQGSVYDLSDFTSQMTCVWVVIEQISSVSLNEQEILVSVKIFYKTFIEFAGQEIPPELTEKILVNKNFLATFLLQKLLDISKSIWCSGEFQLKKQRQRISLIDKVGQ